MTLVSRMFRLLAPALLFLGLASCVTNPVSGTPDLVFMTEAQEISLGRQNDPKIRQQYGVYDDPKLQAYVQRVGERLAKKSHRPHLKYTFTVLDGDEVNAFALPGGYIYITRGILAYIQNEAELAAVLGHEIGHVTARHGVGQYTRAMTAQIGAGILSQVVPGLGNQIGQELINIIGNALLSGYGREDELQADRLGAEYITRTGYNPEAVIGVVSILKNQEEFEKKRAAAENREPRVYHGVFASHPSADDRLQQAVAEANRFKTGATTQLARDDYLKHLDGVVFGDSPREGVRRGSSFYHRDLNFAVDFPASWKIANQPKAVVATAPDRAARLDFSVANIGKANHPREFIDTRLKTGDLARTGKVEGSKLTSHTGVAHINTPFGKRDTRVSVLFHGPKAFVLFGTTKEAGQLDRYDAQFLATARSLRPLSEADKKLANGLRLRTKKAVTGDSFASLAKKSPLNQHGESILRLINARFPEGEPKPGEVIKVIE
ncbi:MAG TPA: M48 family metalloprotease [Burkholderiales bacterium]|nr:M48 family metalloprotease [Burkholderiales bacterium]